MHQIPTVRRTRHHTQKQPTPIWTRTRIQRMQNQIRFIKYLKVKLNCPNELLPSINPEHLNNERRIVVHPLAFINTPPLEIVGTPVPARRTRHPVSSPKRPRIFDQKHPFISKYAIHDASLYKQLWDWLSIDLLARQKNRKDGGEHYKKYKTTLPVPIELVVVTISDKNWFYKLAALVRQLLTRT